MADVSKTVAIIFTGDSSDAQAKVADLGKSLESVGSTETTGNIGAASKAIDSVGESSKNTDTAARNLGEGLKKLATDAGVPNEALDGIDKALLRIGAVGTGSAVLAAAAIAAIGIAGISAGGQATEFKTKIENLTGSSDTAKESFGFVREAVRNLSISLEDGLDLYSNYMVKLSNANIDTQVANDAFIGISAAIKGQGGDYKETKTALEKFVEVAKDGKVDLKELDDKLGDIPGALQIFSRELGVPIEDLRKLAENGKIGKEEIALLAAAMREQDYGSLTPVSDALGDLWQLIKDIALDLGAETGFKGALWIVQKAIEGVTLTISGSTSFIELFGGTLANIAFTIANADFSGFGERQNELLTKFSGDVETARDKFLGLNESIAKSTAAGQGEKDYKAMADSIADAGDKADAATKKTDPLAVANKAAAAEAKALAEAAKLQETALHNAMMEAIKAQEAADKYVIEMEKIASNERIKLIEATVKINVAQIEAQAKQVVAAFESIDNSVNATSKNLDTLFGLLPQFDSFSWTAQDIFETQLDITNKRLDKELALQAALVNAQISNMQAQTAAMSRGDAMIKIDGAGLQPHLEAFMWEVLKAVQTRVNSQGLSMLLGVGP